MAEQQLQKKFKFTNTRLNKEKFIQTYSKTAKVKRDYWVRDSETKGFYVRISKAGTKKFYYRARNPHTLKVDEIPIGEFTGTNLKVAQERCLEIYNQVVKGEDPAAIRKQIRQAPTVNDLFEKWRQRQEKKKVRALNNDVSRYNNHVKPRWGGMKVTGLSEKGVQQWFDSLPEKKQARGVNKDGRTISPVTANRAIDIFQRILSVHFEPQNNPAIGIKRNPEKARSRRLSDIELARLIKVLPSFPQDVQDLVSLALLSGARRGNLISMEWKELSLDYEGGEEWRIPANKFKNKNKHTIPLVPDAVAILKRRHKKAPKSALHDDVPKSTFVFPGKGRSGHITELKRPWTNLRAKAGLDDFRFHDLRRSSASILADKEVGLPIIALILGQATLSVTDIYSRPSIESARKAMVEGFKDRQGKIQAINGGE